VAGGATPGGDTRGRRRIVILLAVIFVIGMVMVVAAFVENRRS
jgi:hypothetical protein